MRIEELQLDENEAEESVDDVSHEDAVKAADPTGGRGEGG